MYQGECSISGCDRTDISGRGLCSLHYQRYRYRGTLDEVAPPKRRTCEVCGEPIIDKDARAIYCSPPCKEKGRSLRYQANRDVGRSGTCVQCGASLVGKRTDAKFCSPRCSTNFRNAETAARVRENRPLCANCGQRTPLHRRRFCSDACKALARRAETYGLHRDELDALLAQHGVCAICGTEDWGRQGPQVDHDHADGRVRGVLCVNCNNGLGRFGDDPARLRLAADYLEAGVARADPDPEPRHLPPNAHTGRVRS